MNDKSAFAGKAKSVRPRKKVWEIKNEYHCSVIGACLRPSDLRKLARKKVFRLQPGLSSYQVHSILVSCAASRNAQSRALQKMLDARYKPAINRYARAGNDEEIRKLWKSDLQASDIAGAYWATMTHPLASSRLTAETYGQIHMLEHDFLGEYQRSRKTIEKLRHKIAIFENEKKSYEYEITELKEVKKDNILMSEENTSLRKKLEQYESAESEFLWSLKLEEVKGHVRILRRDNTGLSGRIDELSGELEESNKLLEQANRTTDKLEKRNAGLELEKKELEREIVSLETTLFAKNDTFCSGCGDKDTGHCPGPDLCGKTVLYVGGQHNMVPRYKQLVERYGGQFIHHDGGKEESKAQLPKVLERADAVFCPVSCISHDACSQVKKICKRCDKPFFMMRSSGLSSLARELNNIAQ